MFWRRNLNQIWKILLKTPVNCHSKQNFPSYRELEWTSLLVETDWWQIGIFGSPRNTSEKFCQYCSIYIALHLHLTYSADFFLKLTAHIHIPHRMQKIFFPNPPNECSFGIKKLFCALNVVCMHSKTRLMPPDDSLSKELRISCIAKSWSTKLQLRNYVQSTDMIKKWKWSSTRPRPQGRGALSFPATQHGLETTNWFPFREAFYVHLWIYILYTQFLHPPASSVSIVQTESNFDSSVMRNTVQHLAAQAQECASATKVCQNKPDWNKNKSLLPSNQLWFSKLLQCFNSNYSDFLGSAKPTHWIKFMAEQSGAPRRGGDVEYNPAEAWARVIETKQI